MSEWISVKDRLPEERGSYLVFEPEFIDSELASWSVLVARYYETDKTFNYNFQVLSNVTHWMPLPEPPEDANA